MILRAPLVIKTVTMKNIECGINGADSHFEFTVFSDIKVELSQKPVEAELTAEKRNPLVGKYLFTHKNCLGKIQIDLYPILTARR